MNCFQWQNHASDYLDGALPEATKREADDHLESCKDCTERYKHYRLIISSIASQPRSPLPSPMKKAPLSATLPRMDTSRMSRSRWERIPWYLRTILEGVGIVFLVLTGISSAPLVRSLYEKNIEKSISDFRESLADTDLSEGNELNLSTPADQGPLTSNPSQTSDDLSGEDERDDAPDDVQVGRSQLWRFTLKTVSPDELRPEVVKALIATGVPQNTPGIQGIKVPGGIEFDLLLPQTLVPNIKHTLQKLAPPLPARPDERGTEGSESFSWYKVRSRRKVPDGKSQVVIWLSQPN